MEARLSLVEIRPESRTSGKSVEQLMAAEAVRIEAAIPRDCERIALDEHGNDHEERDRR